MNRILVRIFVTLLFAGLPVLPAVATPAPTCSSLSIASLPFTCVMPEPPAGTPEAAATFTLAGDTFSAGATGIIELFDADGTTLSDFISFTNVGGVATIVFVSDTEGMVVIPPGLPVLGKSVEGTPLSVSINLTSGAKLKAKICSDSDGKTPNACHASDSISLNVVGGHGVGETSEPGTLGLALVGLIGLGPALKWISGS